MTRRSPGDHQPHHRRQPSMIIVCACFPARPGVGDAQGLAALRSGGRQVAFLGDPALRLLDTSETDSVTASSLRLRRRHRRRAFVLVAGDQPLHCRAVRSRLPQDGRFPPERLKRRADHQRAPFGQRGHSDGHRTGRGRRGCPFSIGMAPPHPGPAGRAPPALRRAADVDDKRPELLLGPDLRRARGVGGGAPVPPARVPTAGVTGEERAPGPRTRRRAHRAGRGGRRGCAR